MKTLIVTGGTVNPAFALSYIEQQKFDYFIAADFGMHFFAQTGKIPNEILGDFDSADLSELQQFRQNTDIIFHQYQAEKDAVDTELALQLAIGRGSSEVHILGGTGTRLDHVLGTVHLLGIALEQGIACFLADEYNRIRLLKGRTVLKKAGQYGDYVSLLPLAGEAKGVSLSGFKYPLNNYTMDVFHSIGISNEIVAEEAVIDLTDGILILIESKDESILAAV